MIVYKYDSTQFPSIESMSRRTPPIVLARTLIHDITRYHQVKAPSLTRAVRQQTIIVRNQSTAKEARVPYLSPVVLLVAIGSLSKNRLRSSPNKSYNIETQRTKTK
jgi:hypothetical protein